MSKIVFIHHSVGGHWLAHDDGGLVSALNANGFYVNDITYGWQPPALDRSPLAKVKARLYGLLGKTPTGALGIGDRTDIGQWREWFLGKDSALIMDAVFRENAETTVFGEHGNLSSAHPTENPGASVENEVVMIKPCYPNARFGGDADDPPATGANPPRPFTASAGGHTVANCKRVCNDILAYFDSRPDKFFVVLTPSPRLQLPEDGRIARGFANWLVHGWLAESGYRRNNVMVFDLFNVLTSSAGGGASDLEAEDGNHHRVWNGEEQHQVATNNNVLVYPRAVGDNHPSPDGLRKATEEFVGLFLKRYGQWKSG